MGPVAMIATAAASVILAGCGLQATPSVTPPAPSVTASAPAAVAGAATSPIAAAGTTRIAAAAVPVFTSSIRPINSYLRKRMAKSWRPGCPVGLSNLRYVRVRYWDFNGSPRNLGELVVLRSQAPAVVSAMRALYRARFPIRTMRLVDVYGASDDRSMAADNTSAHNCRRKASGNWSEHAYGRAMDINPRENPHVLSSGPVPPNGSAYAYDRRPRKGVITRSGPAVRAFSSIGWYWGGNYNSPDYQHFSSTGG